MMYKVALLSETFVGDDGRLQSTKIRHAKDEGADGHRDGQTDKQTTYRQTDKQTDKRKGFSDQRDQIWQIFAHRAIVDTGMR
jgi:hypothetical protein